MTLFLNPTVNSYERLGKNEAPLYVSWSHQNRSQLVRIPAAIGERVRMELRSPDPSLNPYLAFALILSAGLDGMASPCLRPLIWICIKRMRAPRAALYLALRLGSGDRTCAEQFLYKSIIGDETLRKYLAIKKKRRRIRRG